jgi:hypothetical protein
VFYVGKGYGKRAWKTAGRNERWTRTYKKHGMTVEIVFDSLSEQEAFQCEKDTILEFRYFGAELCNMTDGGEGTSGYKPSETTKAKISKIQKGRIKTEQERKNISKAQIGRVFSKEHIENMSKCQLGKKQSEETKLKRALTLKEVGTCNDRNTYLFYSSDDVFVGTREELSQYTGIPKRKFRLLFSKQRTLVTQKWSVLRFMELLNLKEILCP